MASYRSYIFNEKGGYPSSGRSGPVGRLVGRSVGWSVVVSIHAQQQDGDAGCASVIQLVVGQNLNSRRGLQIPLSFTLCATRLWTTTTPIPIPTRTPTTTITNYYYDYDYDY